MLISYHARLCYFAMPKTGSTAIEDRLRPECNMVFQGNAHTKHMSVREYHRHLLPVLRLLGAPRIELCAVVRDPVDWLRSWYRYRQRETEEAAQSTKDINFETFVSGLLAETPPEYTHYVGNQFDFLADDDGQIRVEHLFRYDQMHKFHNFLEDRLGKSFEFRRLNVSPRTEAVLSDSLREELGQAFKADFDLYDSID